MSQTMRTKYSHGTDKWLPPKKRHRGCCVASARPPPPPPPKKLGTQLENRFPTHSNSTNGTRDSSSTPGDTGQLVSEPLRYTTDVVQRLLDRNAEILQSWVRVKERGGVTMSGVPHELQKNLSGLAAAAIHDGADDFFPLRPGNIEIGGKDLVEPLKRTQHSKKAVVDAQARRAGVAALELSVLTELHGGTYATGKQLSDAISVSLQLLLRSKEGKLSKIQKHVRDILLRIVSADLSVPETFKSGYTIIAMLLYDLKKGQLSLDKYRELLAVLSKKDILNAYSGVAMNNNNQNHVSVGGKNATGSGRNQVGKVRSDDNLNEFVRQQRQLQTQLQHQQILQQQQIAAKLQEKKKNKVRRPVGRPPKNYQQKVAQKQRSKDISGAENEDLDLPRKKWPFIMNMGGGGQGLTVKVWLPDTLVNELKR